jgi:hypothetical protein
MKRENWTNTLLFSSSHPTIENLDLSEKINPCYESNETQKQGQTSYKARPSSAKRVFWTARDSSLREVSHLPLLKDRIVLNKGCRWHEPWRCLPYLKTCCMSYSKHRIYPGYRLQSLRHTPFAVFR